MTTTARNDKDYKQPTKGGYLLTDDEWHEIHAAVDKARGKRVTLTKQHVINLLIDHSKLHGRIRG